MTADTWETFVARLLGIGVNAVQGLIRIAIIIVIAYVLAQVLRSALNRLEAFLISATARREDTAQATAKRIKTLSSVIWTLSAGLLWFVVALIALSQLGVNIGPILAGAGVLGLAVGFGAQHLVRDLVSGFFLLIENQIRVGDIAIVNNTTGIVEGVTFRTVILRDQAGVVHVFPNGTITTLANATMDWSAAVVDIPLPVRIDSDKVMEIMRHVGAEMKKEKEFASVILEPLEVFGIESLTDTVVTIRARFKTLPAEQYTVAREFRRRVKYAVQAAGLLDQNTSKAAALPAPTSS
ncbi:MAG TPA: mechanosensitive ion channel family protein [Candidatus Binatia bacterium]|nr:mechanosensitive ion channel family protein [Candidatus Binatia bacterium]